MKKNFALFLALSMLFTLVACGSSNNQATIPSAESSQPTTDKAEKITDGTEGTTGVTQTPTDGTTTPSTQAPTTTPPSTRPSTTEPPTTKPPTTEPPATESPTTKPPTTEPPATEPPSTETTESETVFNFRSIVNNYSGIWYLNGYSDVYINIWESSPNSNLQIDAINFALPPTSSPVSAYSVYPYKHFLDMPNGNYWCVGFELYNEPTLWSDSLRKYNLEFANGYISLGGHTFVRNAGSIDQYSDTCYRSALGLWYLENHPTSTLDIRLERDYGLPCGHYFTIIAADFNFSSLDAPGGDIVQGWAGRQNNWAQYGISVEGNALVVRNGNGTRYFYREPTEPPITEPPVTEPPTTEPPTTEPPATEPPTTEPPVTEPPSTEPPVTEPPTTEPPVSEPPVSSGDKIITGSESISNTTITGDVYITSTGVATFSNVTVNGNIYCYGQLKCSGCTANNVYAYAYGSMLSCGAFDGMHGKISGGLSCNNMVIRDDALNYAFAMWGKY